MVLIISEQFEISTCEVMEWVDHLGGKPVRINGSQFFEVGSFGHALSLENNKGQNLKIHFKGTDINLEDITYVWFRRDERARIPDFMKALKSEALRKKMGTHFSMELQRAKDFLTLSLLQKPHLGDPLKKSFAKFLPLQIAQSLGMDIPATILTDDKQALTTFKQSHPKIITKAISDSDFFELEDGTMLSGYTSELDDDMLNDANQQFGATLAQEMLEKEVEIRSFYLFGKFYSMAIFSQIDQKTSVDFRRYNIERPNRNVPFKLPIDLERKADELMRTMGLTTGSLDFVKTTDGRFVFLEINPVGQFGMTSKPCNYYLEKTIASYLVSQESPKQEA